MNKEKISIIFSVLLLLFFIWAAVEAYTFPNSAMFFPFYVSIGGSVLIFTDLLIKVIKMLKTKDHSNETLYADLSVVFKYFLLIVSYLVLIYIFGVYVGTAIYLFAFLYFVTRLNLLKSSISVVVVVFGIMILQNVINLSLPTSLLNLFY